MRVWEWLVFARAPSMCVYYIIMFVLRTREIYKILEFISQTKGKTSLWRWFLMRAVPLCALRPNFFLQSKIKRRKEPLDGHLLWHAGHWAPRRLQLSQGLISPPLMGRRKKYPFMKTMEDTWRGFLCSRALRRGDQGASRTSLSQSRICNNCTCTHMGTENSQRATWFWCIYFHFKWGEIFYYLFNVDGWN
jgi:hypothetical protein